MGPSVRKRTCPGLRWWSLAIAGLVFVACSETTDPSDVPGTYGATRFVLTGEVAGDVLAAGGEMTITLEADGTTAGRLLVPAELAGGDADFDADMAGTYTVTADTVRFTQSADTFVRDIPWIVRSGGRLEANATFDGTTIDVELSRSP